MNKRTRLEKNREMELKGKRICRICEEVKTFDEMAKHKEFKFGIEHRCKRCKNEQNRNSERHKAYAKKWATSYPDKIKTYNKKYYEANKDKIKAYVKKQYESIIYKLTNTINGKEYIGYTTTGNQRKNVHKYSAFNENQISYNFLIQQAIRKHGWESFKWEVLEYTDDPSREKYWIERLNTIAPNGYNKKLPK